MPQAYKRINNFPLTSTNAPQRRKYLINTPSSDQYNSIVSEEIISQTQNSIPETPDRV